MQRADSYTNILKQEFERRCSVNVQYSLRAYARDLNLPPSTLSNILNGRENLSPQRAQEVSDSLPFNQQEKLYFLKLVEASCARSKLKRRQAQEWLEQFHQDHPRRELDQDQFQVIANWYYFALLEAPSLKSFNPDPEWLSQKFDLPTPLIKEALSRLRKLNLITGDHNFRPVHDYDASPTEVPSMALKQFHLEFMDKAKHALVHDPIDKRDFTSLTFALDEDQIPKAKDFLKSVRKEFIQKFCHNSNKKDRVYHLSLQLFPVDTKESSHESH